MESFLHLARYVRMVHTRNSLMVKFRVRTVQRVHALPKGLVRAAILRLAKLFQNAAVVTTLIR